MISGAVTLLACFGVSVCSVTSVTFAEDDGVRMKRGEPLEAAIVSADPAKRLKAMRASLAERRELVAALCRIVPKSAGHSGKSRAMAAYILGEWRAKEAVHVLSSAVGDRLFPGRVIGDLPPAYESSHVVLGALVKIGLSSVPELAKNLRTRDDHFVVERSVIALREILKEDGLTDLISKLVEKEKDEISKARLLKIRARLLKRGD